MLLFRNTVRFGFDINFDFFKKNGKDLQTTKTFFIGLCYYQPANS